MADTKLQFSRNGVEGSLRRMERPSLHTVVSPRDVSELMRTLEKHLAGESAAQYPWATRFAMGLPLAPWQRPFRWSQEQQVRFITSLWNNLDVGTYLVNDLIDYDDLPGNSGCAATYLSDVVLDGQQRLTSLENYLLSKFPVPDASGTPVFWHELSIVEQRFFGKKIFSRAIVRMTDESAMRELYNLRSFGGTPHEEHERA